MAALRRAAPLVVVAFVLLAAAAHATPNPSPPRVEIYGFSPSTNPDDPTDQYDWSVLTTLAWRDDPKAVAQAHSHGARVDFDGRRFDAARVVTSPSSTVGDAAAWIARVVREVVDKDLDGVNFDLEVPIRRGAPESRAYVGLVAATRAAIKAATLGRGARVTVDVPYLPDDNDGRDYDYLGLAAAADALFVMVYDTQALMWGRCVAAANAPLPLVERAVRAWLDLGVPREKLILGLPWYGYWYECLDDEEDSSSSSLIEEDKSATSSSSSSSSSNGGGDARDLCRIAPVPYAGAPCSDAGGNQIGYAQVMEC